MRGLPDSAALRKSPSGGATPPTVSPRGPNMISNDPDGFSSRPSTDSMATIARADRAYHDVAQLHLHEFGGGA